MGQSRKSAPARGRALAAGPAASLAALTVTLIIKQLLCDMAAAPAPALIPSVSASDPDTVTSIPPAQFRDRPQERIVIREGQDVLFRCSLHKPMKNHLWLKGNVPLFGPDMEKIDPISAKRFTFQGDMTAHDFSIELRDARLEDSGVYRCQGYPDHLPGDNMTDFEAISHLTVLPAPVITLAPPSSSSSSSSSQLPATEPEAQGESGELSDSPFRTSSANGDTPKPLPSSVYVSAHQHFPSSPNNLIQAAQRPSMTRLPPPNRLLSSQMGHGPNGGGGLSSASSASLGSIAGIAIPAFWPYILLGLAALLMLVNIYLIYSLVMRHTRSRRSAGDETSNGTQESFENNTDSSVVVQFIK